MRNTVIEVNEGVKMIRAEIPDAQLTVANNQPLPFPYDLDDSGLRQIIGQIPHTPVSTAVDQMLAQFRTLLDEDRIDLGQLKN